MAKATLLWGFFSVFSVFVLTVVGRLLTATTASSPTCRAECLIPPTGIVCLPSVEAPLPRAVPTTEVKPARVDPGTGTLADIARGRTGGASTLDGDVPNGATSTPLLTRAAGASAP